MTHHEVLKRKTHARFLGLCLHDAHHVGVQLLFEDGSISVFSAVTNNEDYLALLGGNQLLGSPDYGLQNVTVAGFISSDLIHPHIDNQHIRNRQAKQGNLLLKHLILGLPLRRIKPLRINHIEIIHTVQPHSLRAPLPRESSIQYRKACAEHMIEKGALARTLGTKYCDVYGGGRELL